MRETKFIEQNKEKWKELEQLMDAPQKDPEKLNELFVQVTDDLSFSRTFYPNRSVRVYLNSLAQNIFTNIYSTRKYGKNRFVLFWKEELPQLVYESRKDFRLSFGIFVIALLIGVLSSAMDGEFVRQILGDSYVEMTLTNIETGDPMAVYKESGAFSMWLGITANNLWVAFLTFAFGVLYGIGTIWMLLRNGIMVGAFQYFFVEKGLFWESFLTIWIHGTLEISAIVIAGAAGFTMGRGLIFPGTFSRLKAFQMSARRGLKIMLGITPIFILAAFFEGYLTRHTETPDAIRFLFILICLGFVLGYFVWYPVFKARRGFDSDLFQTRVEPDRRRDFELEGLKSVGELFSDVFLFYRQNFSKILAVAALAAALWCLVFYTLSDSDVQRIVYSNVAIFPTLSNFKSYFVNPAFLYLPALNGLTYALVAYLVCLLFLKKAGISKENFLKKAGDFSKLAVASLGLVAIFTLPSGLMFLLLITIFPIMMIWMYTMVIENRGLFQSFSRTTALAGSSFWLMLGLFAIIFITVLLFILILDSAVFSIVVEAVSMNFDFENQDFQNGFFDILISFCTVLVFKLGFGLLLSGMALTYYSLLEIRDAGTLHSHIREIGAHRKIKGIEWEGR